MRSFRGLYGAGPLHALGLIACFAVTGYAVIRIFDFGGATTVLVWFACAIIAHDAILFPLYSAADRVAERLPGATSAPRWINFVRVPAIVSGVMLIVFFPLIFEKGPASYKAATGETLTNQYLEAWLAITGGVFLVAAVLLGAHLARARRAGGTLAS